MAGTEYDLNISQLNRAERDALRLLAQGHTAKSIANMTGRTVGSVNERLREARRKTGVGSSRELARLLAAQENRDEQIGVAQAGTGQAATDAEAPAAVAGGGLKTGTQMAMLAFSATALALFLQPLVLQTAPATAEDPLMGEAVKAEPPSIGDLHRRLRTEQRDPQWALSAEQALRAHYGAIPGVEPGLRVICGTRLCEIAGTIRGASPEAANATMQALQGNKLNQQVLALGFEKNYVSGFGGTKDRDTMLFYSYWERPKP